MVCDPVPTLVGVYVVEHVATAPEPLKVQVEKEPVPLVEKEIVPVGVVKGEAEVSVTETVHFVELLAIVVVGLHTTPMLVVLNVTVTLPLVPLLDECIASPP